jgi:2'-5' RNA ligase
MPLRLFIALWPEEAVRHAIASLQQSWAWPSQAALVQRERLHLTLHFLGDVPAERLPDLIEAIKVPFVSFDLPLSQSEVWPNGAAVLRPDSVPKPLLMLHGALRGKIAGLGLPVDERPYRAHVTLARRAHGAKPPDQGHALRWQIDSGYVLVRSLPGGAGYEVLERFS